MTDETLSALLARVHERLRSPNALDPQTRGMLTTVMRDIEAALAREAAGGGAAGSGAAASPGEASLASAPVSPDARVAASQPRLEALAVRFEAEHPSLASLLRQLGELLSQAGI